MLPPPKLPLRPLRIIGEHKNVGASAKKVVFNVNSHPRLDCSQEVETHQRNFGTKTWNIAECWCLITILVHSILGQTKAQTIPQRIAMMNKMTRSQPASVANKVPHRAYPMENRLVTPLPNLPATYLRVRTANLFMQGIDVCRLQKATKSKHLELTGDNHCSWIGKFRKLGQHHATSRDMQLKWLSEQTQLGKSSEKT